MTVDILFPYYGDVAMMKQAVLSVVGQTNPDWRLIVVDDGYPDDSIPGWFESLKDERITYMRNETNLGANANHAPRSREVASSSPCRTASPLGR